jgi:hypothetical protein
MVYLSIRWVSIIQETSIGFTRARSPVAGNFETLSNFPGCAMEETEEERIYKSLRI